MSADTIARPPSANGKSPRAEAVIRRLDGAEETPSERLIKKHVPAWVVSGAVHVAVIALMIIVLGARSTTARPSQEVITTTAAKADEPEDPDLTNDDPGLDSPIEAALPEVERIDENTVNEKVTEDPVGKPDVPDTNTASYTPVGLDSADFSAPGLEGRSGDLISGLGGAGGLMPATFNGRSGATKSRLLREGGGNEASEQAVALGLKWLAAQQKADGSWEYDEGKTKEKAAATGMALLPFLAAGETHRKPADRSKTHDYSKTVGAGLGHLMQSCPLVGGSAGRISENMYAQGIAAMALCEAYGMTKDPALKPYAQASINYIQRAQGKNGSWGYKFGTDGDTSIVGWMIQALQAAKLSRDLVVDDRVIKKAKDFLNYVSTGSLKNVFGYATPGGQPGTARTAVGLLCRYYVDGWGPTHRGMTEGVAGLMKNPPADGGGLKDMYYYYYATQVVHFAGGLNWKAWNEGALQDDGTRKGSMRDWLVKAQIKKVNDPKCGSWDPETGWFGNSCGRLGTTAMTLLTLEVYYRHLPLYKRGTNGSADVISEK